MIREIRFALHDITIRRDGAMYSFRPSRPILAPEMAESGRRGVDRRLLCLTKVE